LRWGWGRGTQQVHEGGAGGAVVKGSLQCSEAGSGHTQGRAFRG